jgi:glycosyltransferase involved in cell wall biosynthesis
VNKAFIFLRSLDYSGAPRVALDVSSEFIEKDICKAQDVHLISQQVSPRMIPELEKVGYTLHNSDEIDNLEVGYDDFVMINATNIPLKLIQKVLELLNGKKIKKAYWFVHEYDLSYIRMLEDCQENLASLAKTGALKFLTPSEDTAQLFRDYFGIQETVDAVQLFVNSEYNAVERYAEDFNHIDFYIAGNPSTGRKGQMIFCEAISAFYRQHLKKFPSRYRSFTVHFTTIDYDWISQTIMIIAKSMPEVEFQLYPPVSFQEIQYLQKHCNLTVCTSLNETFALSVAEGMTMGHVLLRNNTPDYRRQIEDGVNGFLFDKDNLAELTAKIELILNTRKISNEQLLQMSEASVKMVAPFTVKNYLEQFHAL